MSEFMQEIYGNNSMNEIMKIENKSEPADDEDVADDYFDSVDYFTEV